VKLSSLFSPDALLVHALTPTLQLLADGKVEEARDACAAQADEGVAALAGNAALRSEYFALWEQQRKAPVMLPAGACWQEGGAAGCPACSQAAIAAQQLGMPAWPELPTRHACCLPCRSGQ
jgi:hypothetical protein